MDTFDELFFATIRFPLWMLVHATRPTDDMPEVAIEDGVIAFPLFACPTLTDTMEWDLPRGFVVGTVPNAEAMLELTGHLESQGFTHVLLVEKPKPGPGSQGRSGHIFPLPDFRSSCARAIAERFPDVGTN